MHYGQFQQVNRKKVHFMEVAKAQHTTIHGAAM